MALSQSAVSELLDAFRAGEGVDLIRESVRMVMQELIEAEATERIGAGRYERAEARVTERNGAVDDGERLRADRSGRGDQQGCEEPADHLTSPSPGWPSSKSLTGLRFGSFASYICAPSIHTRSGRV